MNKIKTNFRASVFPKFLYATTGKLVECAIRNRLGGQDT